METMKNPAEDFPHCDLPDTASDRPKSDPISTPMDIQMDTDRNRFVGEAKGGDAFIEYSMKDDDLLHLVRTWVPTEARGGGVGAQLARFALDHARAEGLKVTTSCWFIDQFFDTHPEYQDLRAE